MRYGLIVFNPATVNLEAYEISSPQYYSASMTAFIVEGEALNNVLGPFSEPIDNVVYLPTQYKTPWWVQGDLKVLEDISNSIKNHSMEAVINALKEVGYN